MSSSTAHRFSSVFLAHILPLLFLCCCLIPLPQFISVVAVSSIVRITPPSVSSKDHFNEVSRRLLPEEEEEEEVPLSSITVGIINNSISSTTSNSGSSSQDDSGRSNIVGIVLGDDLVVTTSPSRTADKSPFVGSDGTSFIGRFSPVGRASSTVSSPLGFAETTSAVSAFLSGSRNDRLDDEEKPELGVIVVAQSNDAKAETTTTGLTVKETEDEEVDSGGGGGDGSSIIANGLLEEEERGGGEVRKVEGGGESEGVEGLPAARPPAVDELRENFPFCPMDCEDGWPGDGWCDEECFSEECGMDNGDCEDWCNTKCLPGWPGDGQCDLSCYTEACKWDGGDCPKLRERGALELNIVDANAPFDLSRCQCDKSLLGNGFCNVECNTHDCRLDGLDCVDKCNNKCPSLWRGDGVCDFECDTPECYNDKGDCGGCDAEAKCRTWMPGNEVCDDQCNNPQCDYDGGDCIGVLDVLGVDYSVEPILVEFCVEEFVGDGFCDPQCFSEKGTWDGGDCAGVDVEAMWKLMSFRPSGGASPAQQRRLQRQERRRLRQLQRFQQTDHRLSINRMEAKSEAYRRRRLLQT